MWGGRFEDPMSEVTRTYTTDESDRRLLVHDVTGSIAHVTMLGEAGIIEEEEASQIVQALKQILSESLVFESTDEDVHSAVERRLGELVGDVAGKLHTARSRNDQIATDLRLYLIEGVDEQLAKLREWIKSLLHVAEAHASLVMPTYTHLQQAQVTSLGNHLLAYGWMAVRDAERFRSCGQRLSVSPLGAGASAGSTLPIDRKRTSELLGFSSPIPNTLDAVGSRDFVAEYIFCCAQTMVHLSRLAEELIIWSSTEFGLVSLADSVSTGSSALPHKRNPDIAELVRGRTASLVGDVATALTLQKGLPFTYNRDLQEDKRAVFHAHDVSLESLMAMTHLMGNVEFKSHGPDPAAMALPLAEKLVGRGVPFREAHEVVGALVRALEDRGQRLDQVTGDELSAHDVRFESEDLPMDFELPDIGEQIASLNEVLESL